MLSQMKNRLLKAVVLVMLSLMVLAMAGHSQMSLAAVGSPAINGDCDSEGSPNCALSILAAASGPAINGDCVPDDSMSCGLSQLAAIDDASFIEPGCVVTTGCPA